MYRPVPGGVQRSSAPRCGPVDDLVGDLMARGHDVLCVGDGALRYRDEIVAGYRCDFAEQFLSHPSAAPLVQLAHARALREEWVNPCEIQPHLPAPPDAQINWSTRASSVAVTMSVLSRLLQRCASDEPSCVDRADAAPAPRRDPGDRAGVVPASRGRAGVRERARAGRGAATGTTSSPAGAGPSSATPGCDVRRPARPTSPTSPCAADHRRQRRRHPAARSQLAGDAIERGCVALTLEVRCRNTGAQALYRKFGFAPGRRAPALLREHRGRDRDVVPRHPDRAPTPSGWRELARWPSAVEPSAVTSPTTRPSCSASRPAATRPRRRW